MRKYIYVLWSICAMLSLSLPACKKSFLQVVPKNSSVLQTWNDYELLMNGSNFYVLGSGGPGGFSAFELMGDEVAGDNYAYSGTAPYSSQGLLLFQWQDDVFPLSQPAGITQKLQQPTFVTPLAENIYTLNVIINGVDGATTGTPAQKLEVKSEAMAERAYFNFILLNYFTQPYNPATAASDPGYPYTTISDIQAETFQRGTVQQSYDAMIADLNNAIPNLNLTPSVRTRMSKSAGEALLGKIYLSMNRYSDALKQFNAAFVDMGKMGAPPILYNYNQTFAPGGAFTQTSRAVGPSSPFISTDDITESLWAVMTNATANGNAYPTGFVNLSPATISLFDATDWRLKFYTNKQSPQLTTSATIPGGRLHRNNLVYARIGIELSDLYLMRAEVEARMGDLSDAVRDVQTLRNNRLPSALSPVPSTVAADQTALTKFIIDERIREFASTGFRWLDMRRLAGDPLFAGRPASVHVYYNDDAQNTTSNYTLKPARLTLKIPPYILQQNPTWIDNP